MLLLPPDHKRRTAGGRDTPGGGATQSNIHNGTAGASGYLCLLVARKRQLHVLASAHAPLAASAAPPMTLLGVTRLAVPSLMIELEGTAAS